MPNIDTDALAEKLHADLGLQTEMGREYLRAIIPLAHHSPSNAHAPNDPIAVHIKNGESITRGYAPHIRPTPTIVIEPLASLRNHQIRPPTITRAIPAMVHILPSESASCRCSSAIRASFKSDTLLASA